MNNNKNKLNSKNKLAKLIMPNGHELFIFGLPIQICLVLFFKF